MSDPTKRRQFTILVLDDVFVSLLVYREGQVLRPWAGDFETALRLAQHEGGIAVPLDFVREWLTKTAVELRHLAETTIYNPNRRPRLEQVGRVRPITPDHN